MTKWFLLKTDIYQKKVSYMHPWTETFQPYEHVKRKIYKVSRKANRNPRVGYQISNGPGPRPWTRPAPYFRRTITSMWDVLKFDWQAIQVLVNNKSFNLPTSVTIPLKDKLRLRRMLRKKELACYFMIKLPQNLHFSKTHLQ